MPESRAMEKNRIKTRITPHIAPSSGLIIAWRQRRGLLYAFVAVISHQCSWGKGVCSSEVLNSSDMIASDLVGKRHTVEISVAAGCL